jgi:hypothetical protein
MRHLLGLCCLVALAMPQSGQQVALRAKSWGGTFSFQTSRKGTSNGLTYEYAGVATGSFKLDSFNMDVYGGKMDNVSFSYRYKSSKQVGNCVEEEFFNVEGAPTGKFQTGDEVTLAIYPAAWFLHIPRSMLLGTVIRRDTCGSEVHETKIPGMAVAFPSQTSQRPYPTSGRRLHDTFTAYGLVGPFAVPPDVQRVAWTAEITLDPDPEELELAVTSKGLEKFRPTARPGGIRGSDVDLTATLKRKDGGKPTKRVAHFFWEFAQSSRVPGYTMNAPLHNPSADPDLRFEPGTDKNFMITDQEEAQRGETVPGEYLSSTVWIGSYDWGGYAAIKVTAVLQNGDKLTGYLEGDKQQTEIRVPKRPAGGYIADAWKHGHNIEGQSDFGDDEDNPKGDGHTGDGLTLYEEYRGFLIDGQHVEGNPKRKDYFILNLAGDAYQPGIDLFKGLSELEVHSKLQRGELPENRVINPNHGDTPHHVDQHGIILVSKSATSGYAIAAGLHHHPDTPKNIVSVQVPTIPAVRPGATPGQQNTADRQRAYFNISLAHELFHACNVYHHGEEDDHVVVWRRKPGTHTVVETDMIDGQKGPSREVNIYSESNVLINDTIPANSDFQLQRGAPSKDEEVNLGGMNGPYSGVDSCVMRYDTSGGYIAKGKQGENARYKVTEVSGMQLCSGSAGSGVNDANRSPESRYGDAAPGRGNCRGQILVNDAIPAPQR